MTFWKWRIIQYHPKVHSGTDRTQDSIRWYQRHLRFQYFYLISIFLIFSQTLSLSTVRKLSSLVTLYKKKSKIKFKRKKKKKRDRGEIRSTSLNFQENAIFLSKLLFIWRTSLDLIDLFYWNFWESLSGLREKENRRLTREDFISNLVCYLCRKHS